ncbi:hypothetical protein AGMMS49965_20920 [Bacteroidia bacterium]|nr:hypothetical protein AGMMS49965_20920 [Bacteroidia bacterium]
MNEKITFNMLAARLAEKSDIPLKEAETFLKEWSNAISEGLLSDKSVKIKNLGTLKVVKVEDRESIDVSSGNRVVIPAHYKINFTAESTLAKDINAPFAIFETTELKPDEEERAAVEIEDDDEDDEFAVQTITGQKIITTDMKEKAATPTSDNSELIEAIDSAIKAIEASTQVRKNGFSWTSAVLVIILLFQQLLFAMLVFYKIITIQ